jgi:hypothetical protein
MNGIQPIAIQPEPRIVFADEAKAASEPGGLDWLFE